MEIALVPVETDFSFDVPDNQISVPRSRNQTTSRLVEGKGSDGGSVAVEGNEDVAGLHAPDAD